jgi:hypothetical protein
MERLVLPAHETVFLRGDSGDTLYVVAEGSLDVLVLSGDRDAYRIATPGPGDIFGEMSLLTGEPRKATIRTATSARTRKEAANVSPQSKKSLEAGETRSSAVRTAGSPAPRGDRQRSGRGRHREG